MMRLTASFQRTLVATVAFGAAGAAAFGAGSLAAGPSAAQAAPSISAAPASAALLDGFRALRTPEPSAVRAISKPVPLTLFTSNDPGLNVAAAAVVLDSAATSLLLVPKAGDQLCMVRLRASGAATSNCVPARKALTEGIVAAVPGHVYGLLPDAVERIDFTLRDGRSTSVDVRDGYFEAPEEAVGGAFTHAGVRRELGELMPKSAIPEGVVIVD